MMSVAIWIAVALVVAAFMELWAAFLHGRIWHHILWSVHRSHHRKRTGRFEHNDWLSTLHAPIAIALILYGCAAAPSVVRDVAFGAGIGMTLFGVAYVLVHDGLVHGRLPVERLARIRYFARVREAHLVHHQRGRAPFGLFLGPRELARAGTPLTGTLVASTGELASTVELPSQGEAPPAEHRGPERA